jgi:hypothetical protein
MDPERLSAKGGLATKLLASARVDAPSQAGKAKVAGAIGVSLGAAATTKAAAAAATTALWMKIGAATIVTLAVAGGGAALATRSASAPAVVAAPTARPVEPGAAHSAVEPSENRSAESPPTQTARPAAPEPSETRSAESVAARNEPQPAAREPSENRSAESAPAQNGAAPAQKPSEARSAELGSGAATAVDAHPPRDELAREVRAIDAARTALNGGDVTGALAALDAHDSAFPNGALKMEADVLRVDALGAKGDLTAAKTLASSLLAKAPNGPHARHLQIVLAK